MYASLLLTCFHCTDGSSFLAIFTSVWQRKRFFISVPTTLNLLTVTGTTHTQKMRCWILVVFQQAKLTAQRVEIQTLKTVNDALTTKLEKATAAAFELETKVKRVSKRKVTGKKI